MATRKGSNGSGKNSSGKRNGKLSRRALIGGLGGGLALTAFGKGSGKGDVEADAFVPPVRPRSSTPPTKFAEHELEKVVVHSNETLVHYEGKVFRIPKEWRVTIDLKKHTVEYYCYRSLTPTPIPTP